MAAATTTRGAASWRGTYPGGKAGAGVYQALINLIPPHRTYVALCAGHDAIACIIRPAQESILIDPDPAVCAWWPAAPGRVVLHGRAEDFIPSREWTGDEFVFVDPPYLGSVKSGALYQCEMLSEAEHMPLLEAVKGIPAPVMVTHYPCDLYREHLFGWRYVEIKGRSRQGTRTEGVWMNYPPPVALHDYRFLGSDYRERWAFTKRVRRWRAKLDAMPLLQRQALLAAIDDSAGSGGGIPAAAVTAATGAEAGGTTLPGAGARAGGHRHPRRAELEVSA